MNILKLWRDNKKGEADVEVYGTNEGDLLGIKGDRNLWEDLWGNLPNPSPRAGHSQTSPLAVRVALDLRDVARARGHHAEVWHQPNETDAEPQIISDALGPKIIGTTPVEYDLNMAATQNRPGARDGRKAYLAGVLPPMLEAKWLIAGAVPQTERPCVVLCDLGDFDPASYAIENVRHRLSEQGLLRLHYGKRGAWGPELVALAALFNSKPIGRIDYSPIEDSGDMVIFVIELRGIPTPTQINLKMPRAN